MPASGWRYEQAKQAFKAECRASNTQCWLCQGTKGPIDYDAYNTPSSFSVDHVTPTSLGGDPVRRANFKPAHF